jgi:hypothetical protein
MVEVVEHLISTVRSQVQTPAPPKNEGKLTSVLNMYRLVIILIP